MENNNYKVYASQDWVQEQLGKLITVDEMNTAIEAAIGTAIGGSY